MTDISKIEGHGSLDIKIKDRKVKYVKLKITESKRFYTQAIRNKFAHLAAADDLQDMRHMQHSAPHVLLGGGGEGAEYTPSDQTLLLRKLSLYGMMIRDHALHLYLFCLPDLFGKDSILDFDESQDEMIKKAFAIKSAGNNLSKVIAGRAVHATFAEVGKFSHIPAKDDIKKLLDELKSVRDT